MEHLELYPEDVLKYLTEKWPEEIWTQVGRHDLPSEDLDFESDTGLVLRINNRPQGDRNFWSADVDWEDRTFRVRVGSSAYAPEWEDAVDKVLSEIFDKLEDHLKVLRASFDHTHATMTNLAAVDMEVSA